MKTWDRVLTDTYQPHAYASCNYNCKLIKSIPTNKDNKVWLEYEEMREASN